MGGRNTSFGSNFFFYHTNFQQNTSMIKLSLNEKSCMVVIFFCWNYFSKVNLGSLFSKKYLHLSSSKIENSKKNIQNNLKTLKTSVFFQCEYTQQIKRKIHWHNLIWYLLLSPSHCHLEGTLPLRGHLWNNSQIFPFLNNIFSGKIFCDMVAAS